MRIFITILFLNIIFAASPYNLAKVNDALLDISNGDISLAITKLKKSATVNDMVAQFYLGQCAEYGIGLEKDLSKAFILYRRSAERGFPPAMLHLARCYDNGIGIAINKVKAQEWTNRYNKRHNGTTIPDITALYSTSKIIEKNVAQTDIAFNEIANSETIVMPNNDIEIEQKLDNKPPSATYIDKTKTHNQLSITSNKQISDVDVDIPQSEAENSSMFALIIANEQYQDVAPVANALNDGEVIAKYCKLTLGIPPTNIHLVKNATLNNIKRELNIMAKIAQAYKGDASFLIYYAGHGVPDEATRDSYLLPVDGYVADMSTCYKLSDFYNAIGNMPSLKTLVLIDACFSGSMREDGMLASARGVRIKSKSASPSGNMIVITSATGDETAYSYTDKNHGLFTYYILKKLKETNGQVSIGNLFDYVSDKVVKQSIVTNGKSQTPTVTPSISIEDDWKNWTLF